VDQVVDKILSVWLVSNTLEKLNTFLSFQIFKFTILDQEALLLVRKFDRLQTSESSFSVHFIMDILSSRSI